MENPARKMEDAEIKLPLDVLVRAVKRGNEYGWRRADIADAVSAAPSVGLALLGGQVQFVFPDGTCELYWKSYDPTSRRSGETWADYSRRSAEETLSALKRVMSEDLVQEGVDNSGFLREKQSQGIDLEKHLAFIAYFETEEEAERKPRGGGSCSERGRE
jgi:hypothetical protein